MTPPSAEGPTASPGLLARLRALASSRTARLLLVAALLAALAASGRLDPRALLSGPLHAGWLALSVLLFVPNYLLGALRYHVVLRGLGIPCHFGQTWRVTMYATVGELLLPATGGSDLVKAVAASRAGGAGRVRGLASALADRAAGLLGLAVFAALAWLLDRDAAARDPRLAHGPHLALGAVAAGVLAVAALPVLRRFAPAGLRACLAALPGGTRALGLVGLLATFFSRPLPMLAAVLLAAGGHLLWCLSAVALAWGLGIEVPGRTALAVLPLVILANTASVFGGIGGGLIAIEVLFETLFGMPAGTGVKLGLALPLVLNLSRLVALPWVIGGRIQGATEATNDTGEVPVGRKAA